MYLKLFEDVTIPLQFEECLLSFARTIQSVDIGESQVGEFATGENYFPPHLTFARETSSDLLWAFLIPVVLMVLFQGVIWSVSSDYHSGHKSQNVVSDQGERSIFCFHQVHQLLQLEWERLPRHI